MLDTVRQAAVKANSRRQANIPMMEWILRRTGAPSATASPLGEGDDWVEAAINEEIFADALDTCRTKQSAGSDGWQGCVGLLAPNGCCFCPNTFTHIQYIQIYSTLFDIILRRKWHIQSETHSHFFRILRHAMRASRAIRSRAHSGRTFMAFGRDTFRENLHLITFNLIPVACIHANSCWSHSCIF